MSDSLENLLAFRKDKLFFYSPFNFARGINRKNQFDLLLQSRVYTNSELYYTQIGKKDYQFYYEFLKWDSDYFKINTYKLSLVLYNNSSLTDLALAVRNFIDFVRGEDGKYCFIEVPSEDVLLLEGLCLAGFKLVETRLTYYQNITNYSYSERFSVRKATLSDLTGLEKVAREMRNDYDRFHADPIFSPEIADEFLATYIGQSIKGFTDVVLVPDSPDKAPDAFLTANYVRELWPQLGSRPSKMVLSAVSSATRRGWYKKLISEMSYHLKEEGAEYAFMNTQSTNRAVFHTWEELGYKLGYSTHVLSCSFDANGIL
jgi:dTDP-4-amino-4,6-dideoxy-D-galactose acyltransferase